MSQHDEDLGRLGTNVRDALPAVSSLQRQRQRAAFLSAEERTAGAVWRWSGWSPWSRWTLVTAVVVGAFFVGAAYWPTQPQPEPLVAAMTPLPSSKPEEPRAQPQVQTTGEPPSDTSTPSGQPLDETVVLESGHIDIDVGVSRRIVAGPYVVTSGPEGGFELTWDAEADTLTLEVDSGEVSLARATSYHVVVAGDTVRSTAEEFVVLHTAATKSRAPAKETLDAAPPWVRAAKRGEYRSAFALAQAGRVLESLGSLGREHLKLLADVTRLGGEVARSESVLLELRRRFPRSTDAKRAAFYLGRVSEDAGRDADAVEWYREYLRRSAKGSFAAQARGRLLKVLSQQPDHGEAMAVARDYLRLHPNGAYAALAARIAGVGP